MDVNCSRGKGNGVGMNRLVSLGCEDKGDRSWFICDNLSRQRLEHKSLTLLPTCNILQCLKSDWVGLWGCSYNGHCL